MSEPAQIKASVKLQQKIRKVHLTVRQMVFADLLAIGYEPKDAFQIAGLYNNIVTPAENWKQMRILMETNEAFNNYIPAFKANSEPITPAKKKKEVEQSAPTVQSGAAASASEMVHETPKKHDITDEEMAELLSKENQLKELLWKLKHEDLDTKTEMDVRRMIADLTNAKKEQTQVEEKRTVFYLPLKCTKCELYIKAHKK